VSARHGTRTCYDKGCRCEDCREAKNAYNREWYRKKSKELGRKPRVARHGTYSKWRLGCRCDSCVKAHRLYRREQNYRAGICSPRVDAATLRPLVECLMGFGITLQRIARASGASPATLRLKRPEVNRNTAEAIERLHWGAWRASGEFRRHCECDLPDELTQWLEAS
jgi:hypothetical protein